ncbi:unnamed protein product [Symbiodinium necroappetens]|uniref:SH3 domain-containing protein n=1 Tax=Symbiodinium necroappetens TaxID=1628268 RepID=A0A812X9F8_9DINO|nr:unnamed protein product [Symbiodinium necroappetens]
MAAMDAAKRVTTRLPPEDKLHRNFLQASFASLLPPFIPADALRWIFLSRAGKRILEEADVWRQIFRTGLDFTGACIGPEGAAALAHRMPENLQTLSLDVSECFLGPAGLAHLGAALQKAKLAKPVSLHLDVSFNGLDDEAVCQHVHIPKQVRKLELGLGGCGLSPGGAERMASKLPETLKELFLDLSFCHCCDKGLQAIASRIPEGLTHLDLNLHATGTSVMGLRSLVSRLQQPLCSLRLELSCSAAGAECLAQNLPATVQAFEITWSGVDLATFLPALAAKMPPNMEDLRLALPGHACVEAGAFYWLGQSLPASLRRLELDFRGRPLSGAGLRLLLQRLPPGLAQFQLELFECAGAEDLLQDWGRGWQLPGSLLHFELGLGGSHVTSSGLEAILLSLPAAVEVLRLDCWRSGLSALTPATASALCQLTCVLQLELCFGMCRRLSDDLVALFENLPLGLRRLVLDLGSTDVVAALPALSERLCRMRGLRELELHLDHTDMGTPELKLLGKSFSLSTLKRLCLDLRSCYNLKQAVGSATEGWSDEVWAVQMPHTHAANARPRGAFHPGLHRTPGISWSYPSPGTHQHSSGLCHFQEGIEALVLGAGQLQCLRLELRSCQLGSHAIQLAQHLPQRLTVLELSFCLCGITADGVAALAAHLPQRLSRLKLDLGSCGIGDRGAEILAHRMPSRLSRLSLQLGATDIADRGVLAIAHSLPVGLSHLELGLAYVTTRSDCLVCLAATLPKYLAKLTLDLRSCLVGSEGLTALTAAFGPNLAEVVLDFRECELPTAVRQDFLATSGGVHYSRTIGCKWKMLSQYSYFQTGEMKATALWTYKERADDEIGFWKGDKINVDRIAPGWWTGSTEGTSKSGFFPGNYVKLDDRLVSRFDLDGAEKSDAKDTMTAVVMLIQPLAHRQRRFYKRKQDGLNYKDTSYPRVMLLVVGPDGRAELKKEGKLRELSGEIELRGGHGVWKACAQG